MTQNDKNADHFLFSRFDTGRPYTIHLKIKVQPSFARQKLDLIDEINQVITKLFDFKILTQKIQNTIDERLGLRTV